jgi:hypothetical protein
LGFGCLNLTGYVSTIQTFMNIDVASKVDCVDDTRYYVIIRKITIYQIVITSELIVLRIGDEFLLRWCSINIKYFSNSIGCMDMKPNLHDHAYFHTCSYFYICFQSLARVVCEELPYFLEICWIMSPKLRHYT